MKLKIKLEKSTQLLKLHVDILSSKCVHVTDDFVEAGYLMNKYTINLVQLPPTLKCNQTTNLAISQSIL